MIKNTALYATHKALNAKMVSFAGFNMPISYSGVKVEHEAVRNCVGIFDISHMGEFLVSGSNALALIQKVSANDASKLKIGQAQYSYLPNEEGGIVDDILVYKLEETKFLLVVNAANIEKDQEHILKYNRAIGATFENLSDDYALVAVQGPLAIKVVDSLTDINVAAIDYYHFKVATFAGIPDVIISATGYTGSGGVEIYCKNSDIVTIWNSIIGNGKPHGIVPVGLAARDTLRLEMGYCLYGNDIDDTTSPLSAGLGWITKFTKDFVNSENLLQQKVEGTTKKLIAFEIEGKGIPRNGYTILNESDEPIGLVTSGTMSPSLNKGIGTGYVPSAYAKVGTQIFIEIRKNRVTASVIKLPFYKK